MKYIEKEYIDIAKEALLFSKLFTYPDNKTISEIDKFKTEFTWLEKEILIFLNSDKIEIIEADFMQLFITGYPKTDCPPYLSLLKSKNLFSESLTPLFKLYEKYGIEVNGDQILDHIAPLLEFGALLLTNNEIDEGVNFFKNFIYPLGDYIIKCILKKVKSGYFFIIIKHFQYFLENFR